MKRSILYFSDLIAGDLVAAVSFYDKNLDFFFILSVEHVYLSFVKITYLTPYNEMIDLVRHPANIFMYGGKYSHFVLIRQ